MRLVCGCMRGELVVICKYDCCRLVFILVFCLVNACGLVLHVAV